MTNLSTSPEENDSCLGSAVMFHFHFELRYVVTDRSGILRSCKQTPKMACFADLKHILL